MPSLSMVCPQTRTRFTEKVVTLLATILMIIAFGTGAAPAQSTTGTELNVTYDEATGALSGFPSTLAPGILALKFSGGRSTLGIQLVRIVGNHSPKAVSAVLQASDDAEDADPPTWMRFIGGTLWPSPPETPRTASVKLEKGTYYWAVVTTVEGKTDPIGRFVVAGAPSKAAFSSTAKLSITNKQITISGLKSGTNRVVWTNASKGGQTVLIKETANDDFNKIRYTSALSPGQSQTFDLDLTAGSWTFMETQSEVKTTVTVV